MPTRTPEDIHDLIVHLLDSGEALWIPGAEPHAHNGAVPFTPPAPPTTLLPHPFNSQQTPVLVGTIAEFSSPVIGACNVPWCGPKERGRYWGVALPHLAHTRGECDRCEPVWRSAAERSTEVPDDGGQADLFAAVELSYREVDDSSITLLVHIDDMPADWFDG